MPKKVDPIVSEITKDWRRLQSQRWRYRGGTEARMLLSLSAYFGEQSVVQQRDSIFARTVGKDEDLNRLSLVFNMIRKAARKKMGHIWRLRHEFNATPNKIDPKAFDQADVVGQLVRALDFKCREPLQHWRRVWWLVLCGVVISHTPWVEESSKEPIPAFDPETGMLLWRDQLSQQVLPQSQVEMLVKSGVAPERFSIVEHITTVGDVADQVISPLNFFIDAAVPTIKELPHDQRCIIAEMRTVGWVKEMFGSDAANQISYRSGEDLSIIRTRLLDKGGAALASMNVRDMIPAIQGQKTEQDPDMCVVLTAYQPDCEEYPNGRRTLLIPDQVVLDDAECPYGHIPCVDMHYDAPTTSFWTPDFVTDIIAPQKFLNKRFSQLGESSNAAIHEVLLLGGELDKEDIPSDLPGVVIDGLDEQGQPKVVPMQRGQLPAFFMQSIENVAQFILAQSASDLTQHTQYPGQLRGPLSLPLLQELIDSEDAPFYEHLGMQLAAVKQMRVDRVQQFYPPIRTLQYTGDGMKDEVLVFHTDETLRSGTAFTITVDPSTLMPELSAMRRARVVEDLSGPLAIMYTNRHTGQLDPSLIARAIKYTDRDVEDRAAKARKLAQHLIARLWRAEPLPPQCPFAFWDHNTMLDEYDATMMTTEWLEASPQVQQLFIEQYEKHRAFLSAMQEAQAQSVQNQMVQGAMAQASQMAAAKAASAAIDAALGQIQTSASMTRSNVQIEDQGNVDGNGDIIAAIRPMKQLPGGPQRNQRALPPRRPQRQPAE